jgi:hypothetical protein
MIIDSRVMLFFGVTYFAPVDIKVSQFHREVIFLKCKNGIIAMNVNELGIPELLFHLKTTNIKYDF